MLVPTHRQCFTVTRVVYTGLPGDNPFTVFRDMSRHLSVFITARDPSAPADCKQTLLRSDEAVGDGVRTSYIAAIEVNLLTIRV